MKNKRNFFSNIKGWFALLVFPLAGVAAYFLFEYVFGNGSNFVGGNNHNQPLEKNYLGIVYKGGPLVVVLLAFAILVITYIIERAITFLRSRGKSSNEIFLGDIKEMLELGKVDEAIVACDQQKGTVANVIKSGLEKYKEVLDDPEMRKDEKFAIIQSEIDEATQLELPTLNKNLMILATLTPISTLYGLLGTVTGIIKSFAALARTGAPDAVGLAQGISEALITTALGIVVGSFAAVSYNFFTTKIENVANVIEEAGYAVLHTFNKQQKEKRLKDGPVKEYKYA